MRYLIANFKARLTQKQVEDWIKEFTRYQWSKPQDLELVVCPAFVHLDEFKELALRQKIKLGVQDLSPQTPGPFTGEITASTLKKEGVAYAILGHSERRKYFNETNQMVWQKVKQALKYQITPIICVDQNNFSSQIKLINQPSAISHQPLLYAYEPPSAIGTGKPEKPENAEKVVFKIKKRAQKAVLYGGSVNPENAALFTNQPSIDGLLVATASLKAKSFLKIAQRIHE